MGSRGEEGAGPEPVGHADRTVRSRRSNATGQRAVGFRRAGALSVELRVQRVGATSQARSTAATLGDGTVVVTGQVSVGRRGWHFSADASRRRKRLTVQLVGHRDPALEHAPDIETYAYEIAVRGLASGVYEVYVTMSFPVPGVPGTAGGDPHFAGAVAIAAGGSRG